MQLPSNRPELCVSASFQHEMTKVKCFRIMDLKEMGLVTLKRANSHFKQNFKFSGLCDFHMPEE